jgi:flagellar secretion chaperone FliS
MSFAPKSIAQSYRHIGVETELVNADPHRVIELLFDGAIAAINRSRDALIAGDVARRTQAITLAIRIIQDGLQASLDLSKGTIATNLDRLYDYFCFRLLAANREADEAPLLEVGDLVQQLRATWSSIAPAQGQLP